MKGLGLIRRITTLRTLIIDITAIHNGTVALGSLLLIGRGEGFIHGERGLGLGLGHMSGHVCFWEKCIQHCVDGLYVACTAVTQGFNGLPAIKFHMILVRSPPMNSRIAVTCSGEGTLLDDVEPRAPPVDV